MTLRIPAISLVSKEESMLMEHLTVENSYYVDNLSEVPEDVLESSSILWEIQNNSTIPAILRIRRGYCRDFVMRGEDVRPLYS